MSSTPVNGAGTRPAGENKRRSFAREPKAIRELRAQLHDMRNAAKPFLIDEARKVYWDQAWELTVVHAATRVESNRKEFYGLRVFLVGYPYTYRLEDLVFHWDRLKKDYPEIWSVLKTPEVQDLM